jgi:putative FmdB family regulatory protein
MPIYEYECKKCNHHFEQIQKISDAPLQICPNCHQPEVSRVVSPSGFQLKGTGWYETDFKTKPKKGDKSDA